MKTKLHKHILFLSCICSLKCAVPATVRDMGVKKRTGQGTAGPGAAQWGLGPFPLLVTIPIPQPSVSWVGLGAVTRAGYSLAIPRCHYRSWAQLGKMTPTWEDDPWDRLWLGLGLAHQGPGLGRGQWRGQKDESQLLTVTHRLSTPCLTTRFPTLPAGRWAGFTGVLQAIGSFE